MSALLPSLPSGGKIAGFVIVLPVAIKENILLQLETITRKEYENTPSIYYVSQGLWEKNK